LEISLNIENIDPSYLQSDVIISRAKNNGFFLSKKSKCDKCVFACDATNPILITHAISHRLSRSHLLLRVRRIGDLNDAARAALAPLLGDDDAAVNLDCDVDDVTRPVSVTTVNTTDGNAASRDSEMVGWGDNRRTTGAAEGYRRRDNDDADGRTWRRRRRSGR
jgi:hypothetical protein